MTDSQRMETAMGIRPATILVCGLFEGARFVAGIEELSR